ncbi:MAG TPA: ABC transporter substrate-binding protein, partial [Promineifilum sp.]|nr:ABC transporter substrate-binding protein [Promineifilum sp.]
MTRIAEQFAPSTGTPEPATAPEEVKPPVVLDMSLIGTLPNLDPGLAQSQAQLDMGQNLFAGLTNYNPDTNTIEPELATSWSIAPDGRTWTFKLRDDLFWVRPSRPLPG